MRNYIRKQFAFETEKEAEHFETLIMNLKYKTGETRQDVLVVKGLELQRDIAAGKIRIIEVDND